MNKIYNVRKENPIVQNSLMRGYEDLANAIILQTMEDYRAGVIDNKQMRKFFKSDWCKTLTKISGERLIEIAEELPERKENIRRMSRKA